MTKNHKLLSLTLILSLILGILIFAAGCGKSEPAPAEETAAPKSDVDLSDPKDVGDGDTQFYFVAVDRDEDETVYLVHTDEKTIGEALQDVDLIETEGMWRKLTARKPITSAKENTGHCSWTGNTVPRVSIL